MSHVVQLPRTETRRGSLYCSLLLIERVNLDPRVPPGMAYEGKHYRPGSRIPLDVLVRGYRETGSPVLVLERTEAVDSKQVSESRRKWVLLDILWRYDIDREVWIELARLLSPCEYTSMEFRRLTHCILKPCTLTDAEMVEASATRLHTYIESEVQQLQVDKAAVYERVLFFLVARIVADWDSMEWPGRAAVRQRNIAAR